MLETLPPYLADEPFAQTVIDVEARELERIEATANLIREKLMPTQADDTFDLLAIWEQTLGLPVKPAGQSVESRRGKVLVAFRKIGSGAEWMATMTEAVGSDNWKHTEGPGAYTITIEQPHAVGSYEAATVEQIARRITPAHLQLAVTDTDGFIVGISIVGVDKLEQASEPRPRRRHAAGVVDGRAPGVHLDLLVGLPDREGVRDEHPDRCSGWQRPGRARDQPRPDSGLLALPGHQRHGCPSRRRGRRL